MFLCLLERKYDLLPVLRLAISKSRLIFQAASIHDFVRLTNVPIARRDNRYDEVEFSQTYIQSEHI